MFRRAIPLCAVATAISAAASASTSVSTYEVGRYQPLFDTGPRTEDGCYFASFLTIERSERDAELAVTVGETARGRCTADDLATQQTRVYRAGDVREDECGHVTLHGR